MAITEALLWSDTMVLWMAILESGCSPNPLAWAEHKTMFELSNNHAKVATRIIMLCLCLMLSCFISLNSREVGLVGIELICELKDAYNYVVYSTSTFLLWLFLCCETQNNQLLRLTIWWRNSNLCFLFLKGVLSIYLKK